MNLNNSDTTFNKRTLIIILFFCSFIIYGFSLPFSLKGTPHFSPGNDFSNHAHMAFRFAESFKSGQIIPRTIVSPTEFSDATVQTIDIPTFQYYGFFEGLVFLPFHLLGVSDCNSVIFSSIIIRFLGLLFLFETCLLLGASPLTAFLASFSLLISPYTLTVFYGRGALAETFAQSLLVLIPYGYALAYRGHFRHAIIAFTSAFFLLALCHNIFLLYGLVFLAILVIFSFQYKIILSSIIGTILGIFMSAWQWLPSQTTVKDLTIFGVLNSWKLGVIGVELNSASLHGALGIPHPYLPIGLIHPLPIYFTIGWWTLPFILLTIITIFQKEKRQLAFSFFICSLIFILLTFWPFNQFIYPYIVPKIFGIIQSTSRLLGFVSLLGAICFAIAIPKIHKNIFYCLLVLMLTSQVPVFICYFNLVQKKTWTNDEVRGAPINYYYSNPVDGSYLKKSEGTLDSDNRFYIAPKKYHRFFVRLNGYVTPENIDFKIRITALRETSLAGKYKNTTLSSQSTIIHSNFSIMMTMLTVSPSGWYKIEILPAHLSKMPLNSIAITRIDIIPDNLSSWIFPENIQNPKKIFGYSRQYYVKEKSDFKPDKYGYYTIELPMAYSKLFSVIQNNAQLQFSPDFNHRIILRTKDIVHPINVNYRLDYKSILLTSIGIIGFILVLTLRRKK